MIRLFLFLLLPLALFAIESKVVLEFEKTQRLFVSQKFIVQLKVMSTGFKLSNLEVDYNHNNDFVIIAPESAAYNETDGDYSVVVYEYEVYPLKKGRLTLKPWVVTYDVSMGYGMPMKHFKRSPKRKVFNIRSIKGYGFLLATPKLTLTTSFSPLQSTFKIGDAIERTIVFKAVDVPDLLIPNISLHDIEGLKIYPEEPHLSQNVDSEGGLVSTRIQKETYLFTKDGNYTIPSETLYWYNTKSKRVQKERTKRYSFSVIAPQKEEIKSTDTTAFKKVYLLYGFLGLFSLYLLYRILKLLPKHQPKVKKRSKSLLVESINPK